MTESIQNALQKLQEAMVATAQAAAAVSAPPPSLEEQSTEDLLQLMTEALAEVIRRQQPDPLTQTQALGNLPVGAIVRDRHSSYRGEVILWQTADHGYYRQGETTLLAKNILAFKAFDAAEPDNPDEYRSRYGNNDYNDSNLLQWLNSVGPNWFSPQHAHDAPPTEENVSRRPYADEAGFLTSVSQRLQIESGDVFLLSAEEVGLQEGKPMQLFTDNDSRKAYPTETCVELDDEGETDEPDWWWLRTPNAASSYGSRSVYSGGTLSGIYAFIGNYGVRPALNLKSALRVTAEPDEHGVYDLVWV
ncbi:DUF6273 domain-containing protein [Sporosarcina trichiuri]|uniref:DUF6273 domain-containing protein n=1 Tax=Sporosarcina trichiuri TaxID=3056445 RepID=UPI0025B32FCF|nr:DUF6273 domain-containing protein [Sporosarcina sp. 0.2-SM1T-5]WJY27428.1 DUF6273 domain-containing protein [Sporosarcina sp. 0.2-SM1T-5]WJY27448.1 DUF6273 domain-containing protein [Sporosarcina sp. 0.2-SM1T-5]